MRIVGLTFFIVWILSLWMLAVQWRKPPAPTRMLSLSVGIVFLILWCLVGMVLLAGGV